MTHPLISRPAAGALLALLILTSAAPTASARPDPGDAGPSSVVLEPPTVRFDASTPIRAL